MPWSRSEKLTLLGLIVMMLSFIAAALVVPEIREFLSLSSQQASPGEEGTKKEIVSSDPAFIRKESQVHDDHADVQQPWAKASQSSLEDFRFQIEDCRRGPLFIYCAFFIENPRGDDRGIAILGGSAVDDNGVDRLPEQITFGNGSARCARGSAFIDKMIPAQTRLRAVISYPRKVGEANNFTLIRLLFRTREGASLTTEFRDIPLL